MSVASSGIIGLGVATVDELLVLDHHPRINEKTRIVSRTRQGGGLTATALVAAARMGCRCGYLTTLGNGELSTFLRSELRREGITLFENGDHPEAEPFYSLVLTERDTGERSIIWDDSQARPPRIGREEREMLLRADCLFVDHVYAGHILDAVAQARQAGVPVVGDFERTTEGSLALLALTDHVILPRSYACEIYADGRDVPAEKLVARMASEAGRSAVCVTDGIHGAWFAAGDEPGLIRHQPAFPVGTVVDTTGCGDVFHGVYAAGVVLGWPLEKRIRNAAAAAALKAGVRGAQAGAPGRAELIAYLASLEPAGDK